MCVCACGVCVAQERTTWCPCTPHSPHAGSLPSKEEYCRSGGGLDLVCRPKRFFLSARSGVKAQCKVYMFENSKLIFADMFKFLRHECCEMHIVSPATPSGSVL